MVTTRLDLPEALDSDIKPRLKMFFSADLVGSTAYKQPIFEDRASQKMNLKWMELIEKFYQDIEKFFAQSVSNLMLAFTSSSNDNLHDIQKFFGEDFRFWKTVGDEVLFWKEVTSEYQVWAMTAAWMNAISLMRNELEDTPLDVKSAVWCAGFPIRNRILAKTDDSSVRDEALRQGVTLENPNRFIVQQFYDSGKFKGLVDFIGAGVDVGFRLGGLASSRKMAVSVDVAYLMSKAAGYMDSFHKELDEWLIDQRIGRKQVVKQRRDTFGGKLRIYYGGTQILKGVMGEVKYPRFWINTEKQNSLDSHKSDINADFVKSSDWETIESYCYAFYTNRRNFIFPPFIFDSSNSQLGFDEKAWGRSYLELWCEAVSPIAPEIVTAAKARLDSDDAVN